MPVTQIPLSEFAARRKALRTRLKGEVGLIFAGESNAYLADTFRPHPHFEYLTGITREPGAVLNLDIDPKSHPAWTGGPAQILDRGRVSKFNQKFGAFGIKK